MKRKGMVHRFIVVSWETVMLIVLALPRFRLFGGVKKYLLMLRGARIGRRVIFYPRLWISPARNLTIGDDVNISYGVIITTAGGVSIGSRTMIGYRSQILSSNHVIVPDNPGVFGTGKDYKEVRIAEDVWVGASCVILPGVSIARGAVIAAGSVVTKDVEANALVAGNPARFVKLIR